MGDILISLGFVSYFDIEKALSQQKSTHKKLGEILVETGVITEEQITESRAMQLDVSYINLQEHQFDPSVISFVPEQVARTFRLIPIRQMNDRLTLAMVNPLDVEAIDLVHFETKFHIEAALATEWRIEESINRQYGNAPSDDFADQSASDSEVTAIDSHEEMPDEISDGVDEARRQSHHPPVVRLVNQILTQAVRKKASDIHIEPRRNHTEVRYRIDGELHQVRRIPRQFQAAVSSRIKIMADLDISERRMPQDGRISVRIDGRSIDLRLSTTPILYGERLVLRILDRTQSLMPVESLGFSPNDLGVFNRLIELPYGIILVTGPTGSGKTTTLYAALNAIKSESTNMMTVEDPVEYELEGINQTNVNSRIGLTFATQLRSILRQDPDIVLVGEIRDSETADVAFRAALTGHLVLSTLHCNDAPGAIPRLIDMGVEPFLVGTAIQGILAQRLVRLLCPDCKEPYQADTAEKLILGVREREDCTLHRAVGCGNCDGSGYRGRTAIREVLLVDDQIRRLALQKAPQSEIRKAAMALGMTSMREDGMMRVLAGLTTLQEVERKVFIDIDPASAPEVAAA